MSDFESAQQLIRRLEWMEAALTGSGDEPGLLDRLDALLAEKGASGEPGLMQRLEVVTQESQEVMATAVQVKEILASPVDYAMRQSIERSIRAAIEEGASSLDERASTVQRVAERASEQMAQSVAQAEMVSRSVHEAVNGTRSELERVTSQVTDQLTEMLKEVSGLLSPQELRGPLREAVKNVMQQAAAEVDAEHLRELHEAELRRVGEEIKADFRQYQEGFQDELVEIQKDASDRVREIAGGRAPSQAIIELYDSIDALSSENESLKKQLASKRGGESHPTLATPRAPGFPRHAVVALYLTLASTGVVLWSVAGKYLPL